MKKQLLTLLLLVCSLGMDAGNTLIPDMKFRRLDTRDGLSNSQINYIFQDSKGFVWIATSYGLNRYDGYRFRTYYSDATDSTTLRNNYVDYIWEDMDGRLWLRQGMNFCVFDPKTEQTVRNPSTILSKIGIKGGIDRIYIDAQKNLYVKTYDEGLYYYNPKTKKKTLTKYGYGEGEFPKEFWTSSFTEYEDLLILVSSDGELMAVNGEKGRVGLPENLQVWDMIMDQRNWVWLATDHEGLIVVDLENKEIKQFLNNKFDETSLSENTVKRLMLDKSGNMWIGAYRNGLNQYIERPSGIRTIELGDINTTVEGKDGTYWLGTDNRGIIKYNPETETSELIDKSSGFASNVIVASYCSHDGALWFGTYNGGLIEIDPNGRIKNYLVTGADDGLLNNNVWSVTEDKWGDIWIGTLGNGVQRLNRKTGKFRVWSSYNTNLNENFMTTVGWIKKGWLIAGHSTYYSLINPVSGKVANVQIPVVAGQAQAAPTSVCVMEDSRGLIWQGSMSGCCVYNPVSGWQKLLDMNSGLFGSSVVGIVEDHRHTMWIVTEHGVSNVTPQKEEDGTWSFLVHSFGTKDGLQQGPYNQRSVSVTHDGKVLIGGFNGLDIIDPKLVSSSANKERPIFSGLKLFGQQVEVGKEYDGHVILEEALDVCKELVLRHDENQFTIQLATDKGEAHNTSRFIYQLEGFSDKWIKTEEVDPNITYMSLHHGSYKLHVRMLNDDGTMGDYEATLEITITPPLIRNRWLMIAFLTLLAGGIYFWRRRFLKKHAERVELENYRNEIHKKHWMSAMKKKPHLKKGETDDEPEPQEAEDTEDQTEAGNTADDDGVEYAEVEEVEAIDDQIESQATDEEEMALMAGGEKEKTDLLPLFREVCDAFKAPNGKSLRISYFPLDEHLEVMGDRAQLAYMLKILLTNSSRFAPANSTVKVFAERQSGNAVIRVIDKGVGIPEDVMPHLFEKIENDTEKTNLHLVAEIAKSHEGTVKGEGNIGGGTVFTITLPLIPEEI